MRWETPSTEAIHSNLETIANHNGALHSPRRRPCGGGHYPRYELDFVQPDHGHLEGSGIDCGAGRFTCTAGWQAPRLAVVTATPDPGYTFTGWSGACHGFRVLNVRVNSPKTCGVTFGPVVPTDPRTLLLWHSVSEQAAFAGLDAGGVVRWWIAHGWTWLTRAGPDPECRGFLDRPGGRTTAARRVVPEFSPSSLVCDT